MIAQVKSLAGAIKDMNNGVYDKTINGECSQCGACCSNALPMSEEEIKRIHRYVKKHNVKEYSRNYPFRGKTIDMTCPFLNDSKDKEKCMIYDVRPEICRQFICCPSKRKSFTSVQQFEIVNVRKEFFGK